MSKFFIFGLISSTLCIAAMAETPGGASASSNPVLAEIDGKKITLAEFERQRPVSLFHARNTFYEAQKKAAEAFVEEYLLERQAQKENLTVPQLLEKHVGSTLPKDPPEEALRVYYEGVDGNTAPFEAVRPQILQHIRDRRMDRAKKAYIDSLRSQAKVAILLDPPRAQVNLKNTPVRGAADAPVTVVEYADYECPYCQQIQPDLDKLEAAYKGKVAFAYKDVPLPMHANAQKASEAAHCAGAQGKYWEYHDVLLTSKKLGYADLKEHARALKLDGKVFDQCLDSGAQAGLVKANLAEGQSLQLPGTPSFVINGRFFGGGLSYDALRAVVEEELAAAAARPKETARR